MRRLFRPGVAPPTLATGAGAKAAARNESAHISGGSGGFSFPGHWNEPDVRGALTAMHWRTCAYCSRAIDGDLLEVEHFRPKSQVVDDPGHGGYWWLAYAFENYYLSCRTCNSTSTKGSRFPLLHADCARLTYDQRHLLREEPCIPLELSVDPVDDFVSVEWRDVS